MPSSIWQSTLDMPSGSKFFFTLISRSSAVGNLSTSLPSMLMIFTLLLRLLLRLIMVEVEARRAALLAAAIASMPRGTLRPISPRVPLRLRLLMGEMTLSNTLLFWLDFFWYFVCDDVVFLAGDPLLSNVALLLLSSSTTDSSNLSCFTFSGCCCCCCWRAEALEVEGEMASLTRGDFSLDESSCSGWLLFDSISSLLSLGHLNVAMSFIISFRQLSTLLLFAWLLTPSAMLTLVLARFDTVVRFVRSKLVVVESSSRVSGGGNGFVSLSLLNERCIKLSMYCLFLALKLSCS